MFPLTNRNELGNSPRLGGKFTGPMPKTVALWKGRPPILQAGIQCMTLAISARNLSGGTPGNTVELYVEGGTANGGIQTRRFHLGGGLSAELRLGNFQHVVAQVQPLTGVATYEGIPTGMEVGFNWTADLLGRTPLYFFRNYLAAEGTIDIPEGAEFVTAESACTLTWAVPQFGATITQAVGAGARIPTQWGAFSCNVNNDFIFQLRGL